MNEFFKRFVGSARACFARLSCASALLLGSCVAGQPAFAESHVSVYVQPYSVDLTTQGAFAFGEEVPVRVSGLADGTAVEGLVLALYAGTNAVAVGSGFSGTGESGVANGKVDCRTAELAALFRDADPLAERDLYAFLYSRGGSQFVASGRAVARNSTIDPEAIGDFAPVGREMWFTPVFDAMREWTWDLVHNGITYTDVVHTVDTAWLTNHLSEHWADAPATAGLAATNASDIESLREEMEHFVQEWPAWYAVDDGHPKSFYGLGMGMFRNPEREAKKTFVLSSATYPFLLHGWSSNGITLRAEVDGEEEGETVAGPIRLEGEVEATGDVAAGSLTLDSVSITSWNQLTAALSAEMEGKAGMDWVRDWVSAYVATNGGGGVAPTDGGPYLPQTATDAVEWWTRGVDFRNNGDGGVLSPRIRILFDNAWLKLNGTGITNWSDIVAGYATEARVAAATNTLATALRAESVAESQRVDQAADALNGRVVVLEAAKTNTDARLDLLESASGQGSSSEVLALQHATNNLADRTGVLESIAESLSSAANDLEYRVGVDEDNIAAWIAETTDLATGVASNADAIAELRAAAGSWTNSGGAMPEGYATQEWTTNYVGSQGFLTNHQSLAGYATEGYVEDCVDGLSDLLSSIAIEDGTNTFQFVGLAEDLATLKAHAAATNNPHGVTMEQLDADYAFSSWLREKYGLAVESVGHVAYLEGFGHYIAPEENRWEFNTREDLTFCSTNGTVAFETPTPPTWQGTNLATVADVSNAVSGCLTETDLYDLEQNIASVVLDNITIPVQPVQTNNVKKNGDTMTGNLILSNADLRVVGAVTVGTRNATNTVGTYSFAQGYDVTASGRASHASGYESTASGEYAMALGFNANAEHDLSYVWCGSTVGGSSPRAGTYSIFPVGGTDGFFIGGQSLTALLDANRKIGVMTGDWRMGTYDENASYSHQFIFAPRDGIAISNGLADTNNPQSPRYIYIGIKTNDTAFWQDFINRVFLGSMPTVIDRDVMTQLHEGANVSISEYISGDGLHYTVSVPTNVGSLNGVTGAVTICEADGTALATDGQNIRLPGYVAKTNGEWVIRQEAGWTGLEWNGERIFGAVLEGETNGMAVITGLEIPAGATNSLVLSFRGAETNVLEACNDYTNWNVWNDVTWTYTGPGEGTATVTNASPEYWYRVAAAGAAGWTNAAVVSYAPLYLGEIEESKRVATMGDLPNAVARQTRSAGMAYVPVARYEDGMNVAPRDWAWRFSGDAPYIRHLTVGGQVAEWDETEEVGGVTVTNHVTATNAGSLTLNGERIDHWAQLSQYAGGSVAQTAEFDIPTFELSGAHTVDLSDGWRQAFVRGTNWTAGTCTLSLPAADPGKGGHVVLYADMDPSSGFFCDIAQTHIVSRSYPAYKPWLETAERSTWMFEFESIPGSAAWYYLKTTQYITE